jgi:hypothetical protein
VLVGMMSYTRLPYPLCYCCRASLAEQVQVIGQTIVLPQVCQWYIKDFESSTSSTSTSSGADSTKVMLQALLPYLAVPIQESIQGLFDRHPNGLPHVKYASFDFACRLPTQMVSTVHAV